MQFFYLPTQKEIKITTITLLIGVNVIYSMAYYNNGGHLIETIFVTVIAQIIFEIMRQARIRKIIRFSVILFLDYLSCNT